MIRHPRKYLLAMFGLLLALAIAACSTGSADNAQEQPPAERTLDMFTVGLSRDLTPSRAVELFGEPDEVTGSGLIIYIYRLNDGQSVWLGFPGESPISYAQVRDQEGATTDLPLLEAAPDTTNADTTSAQPAAEVAAAEVATEMPVLNSDESVQIDSFELTRTIVSDRGRDNAGRQVTGAVERVWYRAPDDWRIESTLTFAPHRIADAPDISVNDGQTQWSYDPVDNRVTINDGFPELRIKDTYDLSSYPQYGATSLNDFLAKAERREVPTIIGEEQIAGRDTFIVRLGIPKTMSNSAPDINGPEDVWVDQETFFVLKAVVRRSLEDDEVVIAMDVTDIRYNPDLDDSLFTFTSPPGATVFDHRTTPTP